MSGRSETLKELAEIREAANSQARGEKPSEREEETELPQGAAPMEAKEDSNEGDSPALEAEASTETAEVIEAAPAEEELIRIGDQEFKTQAEAIKYAEKLVQEKEVSEAYGMGVREALERAAPAPVAPPVEDNFDAEFYANPKESLRKVREQATQDAINMISAEKKKEDMWNKFFELHPDLEGQRAICEHTLSQNWDTIGKMTDVEKAMKVLGQKTRSIFQQYIEKAKPRTELPRAGAQAVSPGGSAPRSVTPAKREAAPLTFAQELRKLKGQRV